MLEILYHPEVKSLIIYFIEESSLSWNNQKFYIFYRFFTVYNCPNDFDVYLDEGQIEKQIYWDEPIFADNVKIAHVMASKLPG